MGYRVTVPPARTVVELEVVKAHLRVVDNSEDGMIADYLAAAIDEAQSYLSRALITHTMVLDLPAFPCGRQIELERPPVQSVSSVKYYDESGDLQTLDAASYRVDTTNGPGIIRLKSDYDWPSTQEDRPGAVEVTFVAGYGSTPADVPAQIRQGILFTAAHFFSMRENVLAGVNLSSVPQSATWCLDAYRFKTFV